MRCFIVVAALTGLGCVSQARAQEPAAAADHKAAGQPIRLRLLEGSLVAGKLSVDTITVETAFGKLEIPVQEIRSFTPGLDSHPDERKRIGRLIQQLGANAVADRDMAQKALTELGPAIRAELEKNVKDEDAERRTRVQKILADFDELEGDEDYEAGAHRPLISDDTVETTRFTVTGKIHPQAFLVQTRFGQLNVALADIRSAERDASEKQEIRKTVAVSGENFVQSSLVNTSIRLSRGDEVSVSADGSIVMSPWGSNAKSTPDGSQQFQWYIQNQIPGGALVGRIGTGGPIFKIGSKLTFTATRQGTLYLAVAMNPQFINQGNNFPGQYNVKIRVEPK